MFTFRSFYPLAFPVCWGGVIARVTLEIAVGKEFDYRIPDQMRGSVEVGSRVKVPFGPRQMMGVVTDVLDASPFAKLRDLLSVVGTKSLVTPNVLSLARWMAGYYCCPVETALKSVLPDSVRKEKEGWKERLFVRALPQVGDLPELSKRQAELWKVIEEWREIPLQELLKEMSTTGDTVRRLEDKGLVTITSQIMERDPFANETILPTKKITLNAEQQVAYDRVIAACDDPSDKKRVFLLHGVTGSGKTEVYLQAIEHTLKQGKGAIVLVPEISLTPQTVERFKARFSDGPLRTLVAVLHSHLSAGEKHDEWHKIRQGRARIVIGARSAVFAPVDPLGLVIVDEEHEYSYKQEESPRYHARDVGIVRAQREGAVVVLGTATPSMETYYNAKRGKYELLEMASRVDTKTLPLVRVVDMRLEARKEKGVPIFSLKLKEGILSRIEKGEQVMLFLNRRGYSASLQCPLCGYVAGCPNCSVSLTYHRKVSQLRCHICGHSEGVPKACPEESCRSPQIRYAGIGTERVEETLGKLFPKARVTRMDSDTLKKKEDFRRILSEFRLGKIDILLGTQMIAKGLHFPNVTLVGIIYADLSLHIPDFRAGERTFQLLTQVAGRAGRGDVEGEVFVQSFTPFHPAIQYARRHDYVGFYDQEIEFRQELGYPPVMRMCCLTLRGRNEDRTRMAAEFVKKEIEEKIVDLKELTLAGPAEATLLRAENFFRYQVVLRSNQMAALGQRLTRLFASMKLPDEVQLIVDIDPANV
ncbi:primosomal protein N' [Verrucomicrobia bacterium]|jgi:primosomal protein N' (replication factor Y) (superfamily II helicase)|nr:primosomal protein N' [Verrucomicrobiota bacterium]